MFDRIVSSPAILGGKPVIKGTRISVDIDAEIVRFLRGRGEARQAAQFFPKYSKGTP